MRIARRKGFDYADSLAGIDSLAGAVFFVPDETLVRDEAAALGVSSAKELFGGIVP